MPKRASKWDELVAWSVGRGLWGLENLSLIPSSVGAAPVQNIGAYGAEAGDTIVCVEYLSADDLSIVRLDAEACRFGYRDSIFKHELKGCAVITAVEFCLSKRERPNLGYGDVVNEVEALGGATLGNIREAICSIRRRKLPRIRPLWAMPAVSSRIPWSMPLGQMLCEESIPTCRHIRLRARAG